MTLCGDELDEYAEAEVYGGGDGDDNDKGETRRRLMC